MCNGICKRLYPAKRLGDMSWYIGNVYCAHCETFINIKGARKAKTSWRCLCCGLPVRHTPYSGRKSIRINKVKIKGNIPEVKEIEN